MKTFDEICSDANIQRVEGEYVMTGDESTSLLEVLRGIYNEITKKLEING